MTFAYYAALLDDLVRRKIDSVRSVRLDERTIGDTAVIAQRSATAAGLLVHLQAAPSGFRCYADGSQTSAKVLAANVAGRFNARFASPPP